MGLELLGAAAFALFFLSDINDLKLHTPALCWAFPAGLALLSVSTVALCIRGSAPYGALASAVFGAFALLFLLLMLHSLFIAIPLDDSYRKPGMLRPVCQKGAYALCRHPGVLWFVLFYASCSFAFGLPVGAYALFSALDLLLALFEDRLVFPVTLSGYSAYRETTPFLFPTKRSISACLRTHEGWL